MLVIVPVLEARDVLAMLIILFAVTVDRWVTLLVIARMRLFAITAVSLDILLASALMLPSAVTVVSLVILLVTARTKCRWI